MSFGEQIGHFILKYLAVPKTPKVLPGKIHIACIGDSITFGAGVRGKTEQTWEYELNQILGDRYQVINYGISGRTLQDEGDYPYKRDKFYKISLQCGADIYLIMLGTNDAKPYNWNRERYERELAQYVREYVALKHTPKVILMTPPECFANPETGVVEFDISKEKIDTEIVPIVKKTGADLGLQVIDLHAFTQNHAEWFVDGVHPNQIGNQRIACFIADHLKPVEPVKQATNPYLPLWEYVPDGEPHVFGERVYLYGSHDRFDGKKFCLNDYVCWSAPVTDLKDWRYEGVIYKKTQDPRMTDGRHELWAPDVVRGKDGRYYLYYCPDDKIKSIGVAVCDTPAGQYAFYGLIKDAKGGVLGERPGDTIQFDPGVFIDNGEIYLYSGNGPRTKKEIGKEPKASVVMTLCDDMLTLKTEPKKLLPLLGESEGTGFEGHEFFEASSIRKIGGRYYLVYSSLTNHELCYAVSDRPDGGFHYGGVVVSNCDLFPGKEEKPRNCFGNNHGGLELINGKYYIFYHRETNRSICSRQGGAEAVTILPDGSIPQVELTSCGLNGGPLKAEGSFSAGIACNLYGKLTPTYSHPMAMMNRHPYITQDGPDYDPEKGGTPPRSYIANGKDGLVAGFKYFDLTGAERITVRVRGSARGTLCVRTDPKGETLAELGLSPSKDWKAYTASLIPCAGTHPLYLCYEGKGKLDILDFSFTA